MKKRTREYRAKNPTEGKILDLIKKVFPTGNGPWEIKNLRRIEGLLTKENTDYFPEGSKKRLCVHPNTEIVLTGMIREVTGLRNIKSCPYKAEARVIEPGPRSGVIIWVSTDSISEKPVAKTEEQTVLQIGAESRQAPYIRQPSMAHIG